MKMPNDAPYEAIVIGCSAGGVQALTALFSALPAGFPVPILVVLHVPPTGRSFFTECFGPRSVLPVREADEKQPVVPGSIYFAPADHHLLIESDRTFSLNRDDAVNFSRPSIDVLFETAADVYRDRLIGVILSGSNADGALGLKRIWDRGGCAIVQSPEEADFPEMPRFATDLTPLAEVLTLHQISLRLSELCR